MISSIIQAIIKPIISSVVVSSSSLTYDEMVIASSPNRYYKQDETSGTIMVDSIAAKNGNLAGSYTLGEPSLLSSGEGTSIDWGGTSNSTMPQDSDFNTGTGDLTVMFMFKANTAADSLFIMDLRHADNIGWFILTGGFGGTTSGGLRFTDDIFDATSSVVINDGGTYHCVCRIMSGVVEVFVNGVQSGTTDTNATSFTRATGDCYWEFNSFGVNGADATTDQMTYYKRALTNVEIAAFAAKAL